MTVQLSEVRGGYSVTVLQPSYGYDFKLFDFDIHGDLSYIFDTSDGPASGTVQTEWHFDDSQALAECTIRVSNNTDAYLELIFSQQDDVWGFQGTLRVRGPTTFHSLGISGTKGSAIQGQVVITKIKCIHASSGVFPWVSFLFDGLASVGAVFVIGGTAGGPAGVPFVVAGATIALAAEVVKWTTFGIGEALPDQVRIEVGPNGTVGRWGPVEMHDGATEVPNVGGTFNGDFVVITVYDEDTVGPDDILLQFQAGPITKLKVGQTLLGMPLQYVNPDEGSIYELTTEWTRLPDAAGEEPQQKRFIPPPPPAMPPAKPGITWMRNEGRVPSEAAWADVRLILRTADLTATQRICEYFPDATYVVEAQERIMVPGFEPLGTGDFAILAGTPALIAGPGTAFVMSED